MVHATKVKGKIARSDVPPLPALSAVLSVDDSGFELVRVASYEVVRRPDGECAAEAVVFGTNKELLSDAVQALPHLDSGGKDLHSIDDALREFDHSACSAPMLPDLSEDLQYGELYRLCLSGQLGESGGATLLCEVEADAGAGKMCIHYCVVDVWRNVFFLGAGDLNSEWLVGAIGICPDDLVGNTLGQKLWKDLRIGKLLRVRILKCKAARRGVATLNAHGRRKKKRVRDGNVSASVGGSVSEGGGAT